MHSLTASKHQSNPESSISLFVSLYLILLAAFIILTKDLSFNEYKQTVAMRSLHTTFGRPKDQAILFGRLDQIKLEDYSLEIEKIIKKYGKVTTNNSEDLIKANIPLDALYYADESSFRSETIDDMILLTSLLKNWAGNEELRIQINMTETNLQLDQRRLDFFRKHSAGVRPLIGLKISDIKELEIIIERKP